MVNQRASASLNLSHRSALAGDSCMGFVVGSLFHFLVASTFQQERGLSLSVLLYMFPVFFTWGSPSFQIFSAACFCVVSGAGGSVLSLLVHSA